MSLGQLAFEPRTTTTMRLASDIRAASRRSRLCKRAIAGGLIPWKAVNRRTTSVAGGQPSSTPTTLGDESSALRDRSRRLLFAGLRAVVRHQLPSAALLLEHVRAQDCSGVLLSLVIASYVLL